ncbi:Transposon Tf2-9 polyprotein [Labeo rohita]|uniref:Gypsy retrotransposon integrase-like protein 1 n=1 Tax=Labeo rohita TaxID=84645 RepID=A0ABQ8MWF6_LABRO|nr:Transposon Tf2-9 polyprotein [Labeo rohita]
MNEVFREFLHRIVVVYIDDILIYSRNVADHRQHVQQVLEKLREHSLYLKLEKCEIHRSSVQFLGMITTPLTSLLRGKPKHLVWNAHKAFRRLKTIFCTTPLLRHPDRNLLFMVEVDASTTGVGAVLSQAVGEPSLHPCAYFSRKLSMAEQNYDVGNRELLAIKLALEEWHHWLEGSVHQFTIFTDHKNLQYLRTKNAKADALSCQFSADSSAEPEPIIPPDVIISPIVWDLEHDICHATLQEPAPQGCPEGKIYVPSSQRQHLLGTVHKSPGSGHPGSRRTLLLLQARYWWPSMHCDVNRGPGPILELTLSWTSSTLKKAFFKLLCISVNLSFGYRPQTNSQTERKIKELGRYLPSYCQEDQHSWSRFLPWAQNSLRQDTTGLTPFQCRFPDARRRDAPQYDPGDLVWLSTHNLRLRLPCRKLSPRYIGPFKILRQINDVTFQLQLPPRYCIHPTFHVSLLKPFSPSATDTTGAGAEPPPPEVSRR